MATNLGTIDRAVIWTSTGLIFVGVVVLGIVEMLDGEPYVAQPITNDAGEVLAAPGVDPAIRTGLVIAGVALLMLYGLYKLVVPDTGATETVGR
jgi:hypothetical protein